MRSLGRLTVGLSCLAQPAPSLKTERVRRQVYRTRDAARADVSDYIERFYNTTRRHSTIGYLSPTEFEQRAALA